MSSRPFERGAFDALPQKPRLDHDFEKTRGVNVVVKSRGFGEMNVHYREIGEKENPPLLLVHGLMTSSYSWRYVYSALAEKYRVIAPDLPGAGRSDRARALYSPSALAEWIGEFQNAIDIEGCFAIGNSLGGYLCMRRAVAEPRAFSKLVNVHSPAAPEFKYRALGTLLSIPGSRSLLRTLIGRDGKKWTHKNVHYFDESLKSLEEAEEYAAPLRDDDGLDAFIGYLRDTLSQDGFIEFGRALSKKPFPIPLLLLYATYDPLVKTENVHYLAKLIPNAKVEMIENTSHFAHVDTPTAVIEAATRFFSDGA